MSIGRNDSCPCGSGKKHKKCCLDKPKVEATISSKEDDDKFTVFLKRYNSFDLLKTIASLSLLPENHGKNIRLELISLLILKNYNSNKEFAPLQILKHFLDSEFSFNANEDPPINLFTDLITFYGGDYLILPGITEGGNFILSNLISAIFKYSDGITILDEKFKINCHHKISLILLLSNSMVKKSGYKRYEEGQSQNDRIYFPTLSRLNELKSYVTFSYSDISQLIGKKRIAIEAIKDFLIDTSSVNFEDLDPNNNPLFNTPIIFIENQYLIISPTNLSFSLTHSIWLEANKWGCLRTANYSYHNTLWHIYQQQLKHMHFSNHTFNFVDLEKELPIKEGIYKFDDDKIAYIQLIYDSGEQIKETEYFKRTDIEKLSQSLIKHKEKSIHEILQTPEFSNFKLIHIVIASPIGREFAFLDNDVKNIKSLSIPAFEFDVLHNLRSINAIDLWKFAIAKESQLAEPPNLNFSFIDLFKFYRDNDDSFYLSDEKTYDTLYVAPGFGYDLYKEAKLKVDTHSIRISTGDNNYANVSVVRKDEYIPVYIDPSSKKINFAIEGFEQPIWISPINQPVHLKTLQVHMYFELTDAICFWLYQIQDDCKSYLKPLGKNPLTLTYELDPEGDFELINNISKRAADLVGKFKTTSTLNNINIVIPDEIMPYLYGSDNEGEIHIVNQILVGINKLLVLNKQPTISDEKIDDIIKTRAPIGRKKKILVLDTNDNLLLDPKRLSPPRYIQDHDIEVVLNSIVPSLREKCPPIGEVTLKQEKEKVLLNIVKILLTNLKSLLAKYDSKKLLERLIDLNESLLQKREFLKIHVPTRIACLVTEEQQTVDLKKDLEKLNRTSIAVRCLVEHVAAEQSKGLELLSITAIDEMIAIMDQIISWGSLCDQIKMDLFDVKISVLPSGRIGTDKSETNEVFDPYYTSKTKENVTDLINSYDQLFPQNETKSPKETPKYLDIAFIADFGISFNRLCEFIDGLVSIGIKQEKAFCVLPKNELQIELNKIVSPFDKPEFDNAMNYLTLLPRGKVETIPEGFETYDISPWRFNRRLSYLRKPLIEYTNTTDPTNSSIYWGFRHLLAIRIYLVDQIVSGRLKVDPQGQVNKAISKFAEERGDSLVKKIYQKLDHADLILDTEVKINSQSELFDKNDLGDIDILIIDPLQKTLFSLECKSISPSRNIKEMVEELSKLFGSDSEKGWIEKHQKRHEWIQINMNLISKKYKTDLTDFSIKSFFITEEDMLTPHLKRRELIMPFVTRYDIEKDGIEILHNFI